VQLFKNNRDAFWGNTKNILTAVEDRVWLALPLMLLAILQYWTPVLALVTGAFVPSPLLIVIGFLTYGIQYVSFFTVRRILRFHPYKLLLFPLVALVGACCITRALYYHARGEIRWRGRTIKVKE
jgi:FtsH-binding integral membrane protein